MKLIFTRHATRQLRQRSGLTMHQVRAYFARGAAVQSRLEANGVREFVIHSATDKECYALLVSRDDQVITVMPIKWRRVAPGFIDQARRLCAEKMEDMP